MSLVLDGVRRLAQVAPWSGPVANQVRQVTHPQRKIFVIGPHRCATRSIINHFFGEQGFKYLHWRQGDVFVAKEVEARKNDIPALRAFLSRWTVYGDFIYLTKDTFIENHTLYEAFEAAYPEAYFILNDRHVDKWIASRLRHRQSGFLTRYQSVTGQTEEQAVETWRATFLENRERTLEHFKGHPRFRHLCIEETDHPSSANVGDIRPVIDMLAPDYVLSTSPWGKRT